MPSGVRSKGRRALIDPARVSFPDMDTNHLYAHLRPGSVLIIDDINTTTIDRLFEFVREATLAPVPRHLEGGN